MLPAAGALPPEAFSELLERRAADCGMVLERVAGEKLARFLAELDRARRQTNLTGPLSPQELVDHALECALGERLIPGDSEVVDIGSGAGFPGIPLALVRSDLRATLVEPRRKRIEFLAQACQRLGIANVVAFETSVSRLGRDFFDAATARAVGGIDRIVRRAPFLKREGLLLAWTTTPAGEELARWLKGSFSCEARLAVPGTRQKVILAFRKHVPRGTKRAR